MKKEYVIKYNMKGEVVVVAEDVDEAIEKFDCMPYRELVDNLGDIEWDELEIQ